MNPREICEKSPIKLITVSALGIALTYISTAIFHIPIPGAVGGLMHLGHIPHFLFAMVFGKRIGAATGGIGMALFDLLSGYAIWAPFTFVISGLMGYCVGAMGAAPMGGITADPVDTGRKKAGLTWALLAMLLTIPIKVAGYYLAEGIIYGNWIVPIYSVPSNIIQVAVAALVALPLVKPMKRVAMDVLSR